MNESNSIFDLKRYSKRIFLQMFYSLFTGIYYLFWNVIFLRYILNYLEKGKEFNNIANFIIIMVSISFVYFIFKGYFKKIYEPKNNLQVKKKTNIKIFNKAYDIKFELYEQSNFFDLYSRIKDGDIYIVEYISNVGAFIGNIIVLSLILYTVIRINSIIILFVLTGILIVLAFNNAISSFRHSINKESSGREKRREYVKNIALEERYAKEIRTTNIFNNMQGVYDKAVSDKICIMGKYLKKIFLLNNINDILMYGINFIVPIVYILFRITSKNELTIGDFSASVMAINMLTSKIAQVANNYQKIKENKHMIMEINKFLNIEEIENTKDNIIEEKIKSLRTEDLSFVYPNNLSNTLEKINININNNKIAILGANGAGKSTLIKVLAGLYGEYDGDIFINNINLKQYNINSYRRRTGVVYQDFQLMSASIIENILMRTPRDNKDYRIAQDALIKVGLMDRFKNLPDGLDSILFREFDKQGIILSGGEMQKLALSRVIAMDPDIIILDEPSSALDPMAEEELYQNIIKNMNDKILIFITHRLSTVKLSDYIYLISDGKIVEEGRHDRLIKDRNLYYEMFNKQAEKYKVVWL